LASSERTAAGTFSPVKSAARAAVDPHASNKHPMTADATRPLKNRTNL